jgi:hypothetical protein
MKLKSSVVIIVVVVVIIVVVVFQIFITQTRYVSCAISSISSVTVYYQRRSLPKRHVITYRSICISIYIVIYKYIYIYISTVTYIS